GDLFKPAFANIAEQVWRHSVFHVGLNALDVGIDMAVGNENVGPAIKIVVEEETAEAESEQGSAADFRARSFIDEEPFSFVVIKREHLVRKIGDDEAGKAGVIVIRGVHTHARGATPSSLKAIPATTAFSVKVPLPLLR